MTELAGAPIPKLLNVGFCGLKSDLIDWGQLEYWCSTMSQREGARYCLGCLVPVCVGISQSV